GGWQPALQVRSAQGGVQLIQTSLVDTSFRLRARWRVDNRSGAPVTLTPRFLAVGSRTQQADNDPRQRASCHEPLPCDLVSTPAGGEVRIGDWAGSFTTAQRAL